MTTCDMQIWVGAYFIDALGPRGSQAVGIHLANCEACRDQVVSLCLDSGMFDRLCAAAQGSSELCEMAPLARELTVPATDPVVRPAQPGASTPASPMAAPGYRRGGSAVCGVVGFQHHLGPWLPMLAGFGWIIASDNASNLLRHRYGARIARLLSRRLPRAGSHPRLLPALRALTRDPRAGSALSYPKFALINAAHAVLWAAFFVEAGYFLTGLWHSTPVARTTRPAAFAAAVVGLVAVWLAARRRRRKRAQALNGSRRT